VADTSQGWVYGSNEGIYFQNMTNKDVAERLKKNDVILIPVGSTRIMVPMRRMERIHISIRDYANRLP
jgi:5-formaminoimidazole-4-carboxamide-1-beta-D-ribofuranosyl 5'-monophosphate synthetase